MASTSNTVQTWTFRENLVSLKFIGKGSFGNVYHAKGILDQVDYAVKQISVGQFILKTEPKLNSGAEAAYKIFREVETLLQLTESPYVVKYFDCWFEGPLKTEFENYIKNPPTKNECIAKHYLSESSGRAIVSPEDLNTFFYIKMSFCESNLREWMRKNCNRKSGEIDEIMIQILNGLDYIHSKGIIHRDLHPSNVFLNFKTSSPVNRSEAQYNVSVRIGDFGLARVIAHNCNLDIPDLTTDPVGCSMYRSPEMEIRTDTGDLKYNFKTDIYSAGLIYLELVHNFEDDERKYFAFKTYLRHGIRKPLDDIKGFQSELEIIKKMIECNPSNRPTAKEALNQLQIKKLTLNNGTLDGQAISSSSPTNFKLFEIHQINQQLIPQHSTSASSTIGGLKPSPAHTMKLPLWLGFRNPKISKKFSFVGRKRQLEEIRKIYREDEEILVVINGLGGVGKTELSKQLAKIFNTENNINCMWLNGESCLSLNQSLARILMQLQISSNNADSLGRFTTITQSIYNLYSQESKNTCQIPVLIVVDNVDEVNEDLLNILKYSRDNETFEDISTFSVHSVNYFFIVTTRNKMVLDGRGFNLELDVLDDEEAHELVQQFLNPSSSLANSANSTSTNSKAEIIELCEMLGNFPLALVQVLAYIKQERKQGLMGNSYKISNYLQEFKSNKLKMLDCNLQTIDHIYNKALFTTWNMTLERIRTVVEGGEVAIRLLEVIAYCHRSDGILVDFLQCVYSKCWGFSELEVIDENPDSILTDSIDIEPQVKVLKKYSLINVENRQIRLHKLMQEVIRLRIGSGEREFIAKLIKGLSNITPNDFINLGALEFSQLFTIFNYLEDNPHLLPGSGLTSASKHCLQNTVVLPHIREYMWSDALTHNNQNDQQQEEGSANILDFVYMPLENRTKLHGIKNLSEFRVRSQNSEVKYYSRNLISNLTFFRQTVVTVFDFLSLILSFDNDNSVITQAARLYTQDIVKGLFDLKLQSAEEGDQFLKEEEVWEMYRDFMGFSEDSLCFLILRETLAVEYFMLKKYELARNIFQDVYNRKIKSFGLSSNQTEFTKQWYLRALEVLGESPSDTLNPMNFKTISIQLQDDDLD